MLFLNFLKSILYTKITFYLVILSVRACKNYNVFFKMYTSFSFGLLPEAYMPFDPIIDG